MDSLLGRWPWPRFVYYDLLSFMSMANAKSVIFDVLFTESQKAFSEEEMEDSRYNDQLLAQGTLEYGAAVHAFKLAN